MHIYIVMLQSSKMRGALDGKQKRSIFAVPDSLAGRVRCTFEISNTPLCSIALQVGVGTCNIGGKGMTDFSIPSKNAATKDAK